MKRVNKYNHIRTDTPAVFETVLGWLNIAFERYSSSTAIQFEQDNITYAQLDKLSNRIANCLIRNGIKKGDRVGISLDRSIEMIACIIGILKIGAAYVPLDPNYPVDRLKIMQEDAQLSLLIIHGKFLDRFGTNSDQIINWDKITNEVDQYSDSFSSVSISGEDVAYVIFTSGSTGRPKGIAMPHRALANLIEWQLGRTYFKEQARVLQYSSISFDVSFQEIATTLASGGRLFIVRDENRRDPRILLDVIDQFKIERLFIPFVALRSLIEVAITADRIPISLKEVITAGEQLRVDSGMRDFFIQLPDAILENQYGPSETHVISAHLLGENPTQWPDLPPIGKPIKYNSIYLLNKDMGFANNGEAGELYLAGRNIALGYLGRDDLTKKSFLPSPFNIPDRDILYKTGDLGLINKNGEIEFLGRADHQIKIRGYRVEPGEINTVGAKYQGIAQCFTHAITDQTGKSQLVTYYVTQDGNMVNTAEFKAYLHDRLPEYMIPTYIIELETIPYTPSGKIDFKSLPKPQGRPAFQSNIKVSYESETEAKLAAIWSKVLGHENIPNSANFFEIGGDSLNAVTLFMEIEEEFGKYLPLSMLTQAPTIAKLSQVIEGKNKDLDITKFRCLQLIQRGSLEKVPLFLVHGGAGNVLMFKDLAKGLPADQPIYAFQWSGWDGYKGESDILEMAKSYKKELRKAWPTGPYLLGGHCIGGIIAIEMARMLKVEGAEIVDPVLVSDAPNLHSRYYHHNEPESSNTEKANFDKAWDTLKSKINLNGILSKKNNLGQSDEDYSARKFPLLAKYLPFYKSAGRGGVKILHQFRLVGIWFKVKFSIRLPVKDRHIYCTKSQLAAVKKHQKTIYTGDILYLKSEVFHGRTMGLKGWWNDTFFGFKELCDGQFDGYIIGGEHNDVLKHDVAHKIIRKRMVEEDA